VLPAGAVLMVFNWTGMVSSSGRIKIMCKIFTWIIGRQDEDWFLSHNRDIPEQERKLHYLQRYGMRAYQDRYFWQDTIRY
jgi:hypothetical protein